MRYSVSQLLLLATVATTTSAFTVSTPASTAASSTALNLFGGGGGGKDKGAGGAGGPGMMDQLAMFKKAQEVAEKKKKIDQELSKMTFEGQDSESKVTAKIKFQPVANMMDPNPDYQVLGFDFDEAYYESATPDELAAAVKEATLKAIEATNLGVAEKYQELQAGLMEAFNKKE